MAYALNEKDLEEEEKNTGQPESVHLGAESGVITGEENAKGGNAQSGSGQYTNLQSYLDQNRQQDFGQDFAGRVGESVSGAEQAQQAADTGFKQAADTGSVRENPDLIKSAIETPESVVGDESKFSEFKKMRDANYSGPNQLGETEFYQPASSSANRAITETDLSKNTAGQQTLLDQYYGAGAGRGGYSQGQKNLDQLLLGMNPGTRNALEAQAQRAKQVKSQFGALENSLNQYAANKKAETEKTKQEVDTQFNPAVAGYQGQVKSTAQQKIDAANASAQRINDAFKNRDFTGLTPEEKKSVGIDTRQALFKAGANGGVAFANKDANINNLTTPEQYAKLKAYADLLGQPETVISDASQIGSLSNSPLYNVDQTIQQKINDQKAAYDKYLADLRFRPQYGSGDPWFYGGGATGGTTFTNPNSNTGSEGLPGLPSNSGVGFSGAMSGQWTPQEFLAAIPLLKEISPGNAPYLNKAYQQITDKLEEAKRNYGANDFGANRV